ncbi:MAG: hypothetical protein ACRDTH_01820 [Pseudonocardiaceae bacterium]
MRFPSAKERLEMLVPPELLARGVTAGRTAERRPGPAALAAGYVSHETTVWVRSHVAPDPDEPSIGLPTEDQAPVFVDGIVDVAGSMKEHCIRILRAA